MQKFRGCRLNSEILDDDAQELQQMRQLVQQLQAVNPTPQPATSPLINGTWVRLAGTAPHSRRGAAPGVFPAQPRRPPSGALSPTQV